MTTDKTPPLLIVPPEAWLEIAKIFDLEPDQLRAIAKTLRSKESLRDASTTSYEKVAKAARVPYMTAVDIVFTVNNLVRQGARVKLTREQLLEELAIGLPEKVKALAAETKDALLDLLSESGDGYVVNKAERLRTALVPHMVDAQTICEVRPVFNTDKTAIECNLVVTLLGINSHDDETHEDSSFVIQLTRPQVSELKKLLEETERKISVIDKSFAQTPPELY